MTYISGWYLIFVWTESQESPDVWYTYVGQSTDLHRRRT